MVCLPDLRVQLEMGAMLLEDLAMQVAHEDKQTAYSVPPWLA
jgi:hypothetical protein